MKTLSKFDSDDERQMRVFLSGCCCLCYWGSEDLLSSWTQRPWVIKFYEVVRVHIIHSQLFVGISLRRNSSSYLPSAWSIPLPHPTFHWFPQLFCSFTSFCANEPESSPREQIFFYTHPIHWPTSKLNWSASRDLDNRDTYCLLTAFHMATYFSVHCATQVSSFLDIEVPGGVTIHLSKQFEVTF